MKGIYILLHLQYIKFRRTKHSYLEIRVLIFTITLEFWLKDILSYDYLSSQAAFSHFCSSKRAVKIA